MELTLDGLKHNCSTLVIRKLIYFFLDCDIYQQKKKIYFMLGSVMEEIILTEKFCFLSSVCSR